CAHLAAARQVLADFGYGGDLAVAAWLHDLNEDTPTSREEIADRFGAHVAALVWAVTGIGATRAERNQSGYTKIRALPEAAVLKLADRIANVEAKGPAHKLSRYRDELPGFEAALAGLGDERMWARLRAGLAASA